MIVPKKEKNQKIAILGAGRLGTALGYAINKNNSEDLEVVSVSSITQKTLERAKKMFGEAAHSIYFTKDNVKAAQKAGIIFICTPDDVIRPVCEELYKNKKDTKKTVIHFSGSKPLNVLDRAKKNGDRIASIHPLKSFASIPEAIKTLKGTEYGITYIDREGEEITKKIVDLLEGNSIFVKDEAKPVYHAAACIASNYLVTLIHYAVYINEKIGIEPQASTRGLLNLIEGTVGNIKKMGTNKALTGPIARGDTGTIEDHLQMLNNILKKENTEIYTTMGKKTAELARENRWIDNNTYNKLLELFKNNDVSGKEK